MSVEQSPKPSSEPPPCFHHATLGGVSSFPHPVTRPLATALLALLLFQSVGLPLQRHWCGGRIARAGLVGDSHDYCASAKTCASGATSATPAAAEGHHVEPFAQYESARSAPCCFDEVRWEVRNAAAAGEVAEPSVAPAPALPPRKSPGSGLAGPALAVVGPRGSPTPAEPRVLPHGQARAYLQVYRI